MIGREINGKGFQRAFKLQVDELLTRFIGEIVNEHPDKHHDVTRLAVGQVGGIVDVVDVHELIYDAEHVIAMVDNHLAQMSVLFGTCSIAVYQLLTGTHDDR